jgi:hypothetical protein
MTDFNRGLPSLVIPSGQTSSNILVARTQYQDAFSLGIVAPATLDLATDYNIYVTNDPDAVSPTWGLFLEETTPPAGDAATLIGVLAFAAFKIVATVAVGGDRTFQMSKRVTIQ